MKTAVLTSACVIVVGMSFWMVHSISNDAKAFRDRAIQRIENRFDDFKPLQEADPKLAEWWLNQVPPPPPIGNFDRSGTTWQWQINEKGELLYRRLNRVWDVKLEVPAEE